ncbi:MAG: hypothetical protein U9N78_06200 [Actinomycetota bacterium]|nr:hypothetical protein [Actinomycetota bacterium]
MSSPSLSQVVFSWAGGGISAGGGVSVLGAGAGAELLDPLFLPTSHANRPMMTMTAMPSKTNNVVLEFVDSPVSLLGAVVPSLGASVGAGA